MRILKHKIMLAQRKKPITSRRHDSDDEASDNELSSFAGLSTNSATRDVNNDYTNFGSPTSKDKKQLNRRQKLANKNIIKNFGRAIANFASSNLSLPYLDDIKELKKEHYKGFINYALEMRGFIQNIDTFKESLVTTDQDSKLKILYKQVFRKIAIIFMKYFSVNWIFSGKTLYKQEYLNFRGSLLRKIVDPDSFITL
jgi:hypothetical protein